MRDLFDIEGLDRDNLEHIIRERSFREGDFTLASGQKSNVYFNLKPTMLDPEGSMAIQRVVGNYLKVLFRERDEDVVHVSGMAVGAVPLVALLAACDPIMAKATFVRKAAKGHGTQELIEGLAPGETIAGTKVIVVEDVCTTGKSIMEAVEVLRSAGAIVEEALTIVERGGRDVLKQNGIELHAIYSAEEFLTQGSGEVGSV
jgi:orotate phosphoribosyltransferase